MVWLAALVAVAFAASSSGQPGRAGGSTGRLASRARQGDRSEGASRAATPRQARDRRDRRRRSTPAGKAIIRIYKEKPDVADVPDALDGVAVQSVTTGVLQARAPTDRFPRPVPIGVSVGSLSSSRPGLSVRASPTARTSTRSRTTTSSRVVNTANIGDRDPPARADRGRWQSTRPIGSATLADFQHDQLQRRHEHDGRGHRADLDDGRRYGDAGRRLRDPSAVTTPAFDRAAGAEVRANDRLPARDVVDTNVTVDVCYLFLVVCFQEARFVNQISITPGAVQRAWRLGLAHRHPGRESAGRAALRGGDG